MKAKLNIFVSILASFALVATVSLCDVSVAYADDGSADVSAVVPAEAPAPAPSTESTPDPGTPAPAQPVAPAPAPAEPAAPSPTPAPTEGINHGSEADNANDSPSSGAGAAQNGATGDAQGDTGAEDAVGASAVDGDAVELPDEIEPSVGVLSQPIMPRAYGSCTASSPKVLTTAVDLAQLAKLVNTATEANPVAKLCWGSDTTRTDLDVYLKLGNDIDLTNWGTYKKGDNSVAEQNWRSIYGSVEDTATATGALDGNANTGGWVPIGTDSKMFSGNFDGAGYTISGLKIYRPTSNYQGLFGYINIATIQGLGIVNSSVTGANYTGGLVGRVRFTSTITITNSFNTGSVTGNEYTGGLIGYAGGTTTITNSFNTGSVIGIKPAGGLVGFADSPSANIKITNSYNAGSITGTERAGGFVGYANSSVIIQNSYNTGSVTTSGGDAGGLVGFASATITNSYNTGTVTGFSDYTGGLVGRAPTATITNSLSLGKAVKGTNNVGRIWGFATAGTNSNNYALASMTDGTETNNCGIQGGKTEAAEDNSFGTFPTDGPYAAPTVSDKNGANIIWSELDTSAEWTATTLWGGGTSPWTQTNGWKVVSGKLPVLAKPDPQTAGSFLDEAMPGQDGTPPTHITNPSATSPFAGTGADSANAYQIGTAYQLAQMACLVNAGDSDYQTNKFWKLTADIDLSDWGTYQFGAQSTVRSNWEKIYGPDTFSTGTNFAQLNGGAAYVTGASDQDASTGGWVPIGKYIDGTNDKPFSGTFDGTDHTISGLKINRQSNYQGLFGYTDTATIQGLGIVNSNITGSNYTGGLVGAAISATIQNSYNTGSVEGTESTGGLVGAASSTATITNSYNTGSVTGNEFIGGLVGYAPTTVTATITNSFNTGSVTGNYYTGGLVGDAEGTATIQNSYNTGSVMGTSTIGGLLGGADSATIQNSYNTGSVTGSVTGPGAYIAGLLGREYSTATITNSLSLGKFAKVTNNGGRIWSPGFGTVAGSNNYALASMTDGTGANTCGIQGGKTIADDGNMFDGSTPTDPIASDKNGKNIAWTDIDTATEWTEATLWDGVDSPWTPANGWIVVDGKLPVLAKPNPATAGSFLEDAMPGQDGTPPSHITNPSATSPFAGTGAVATPYEIGTAYQLAQMACFVNAGDPIYQTGKFWKLTADIDLTSLYAADLSWIDPSGTPRTGGWVPIGKYVDGTDDKPFTGNFDGNGYTISGLKINRPISGYQGLFGYTDTITIQGLGVTDSNIKGLAYTGGFVGYAGGTTTITNSYNTGSVIGTSTESGPTGGLVGYAPNTAATITITNSYNTGSVTADNAKTGGLVGEVYSTTTITNSYNTGSVTSKGLLGGLVGTTSYGSTTITNSRNTGYVYCDSDVSGTTGGLVGGAYTNTTISNSFNTGSVTDSSDYTGGLVGNADSTATITNSYNTGSVTGKEKTGGLLGSASTTATTTITNSYNTGSVTGTIYTGGLLGTSSNATIQNSYNVGSVAGSSNIGGLSGRLNGGAIENSYNSGSVTSSSINAGGLVGSVYIVNIKNSLSLGKAITSSSNVGRIWGKLQDGGTVTASNNYAWASMTVTGGSTITEGTGDAVTNKKNGLGVTTAQLIDPDFWLDDSTGALNSGSIGTCSDADKTTQSECEASSETWSSTWHIQPNWHPTLNGFGSSTVTGFIAQSDPDTNTTGSQDGSLSLLDNPPYTNKNVSYSPGLGTGTPPASVETDKNGVLATVKAFGTGGAGFTAPTGGTFLYWCKTTPTGTPLNICPNDDRVSDDATNVTFTADTTLTAVFKLTATVNFSDLSFSARAYDGTTAITLDSGSLGLSASGSSATLSDSTNLTCIYALDSKSAGTRKVMATCTLTGVDTDRFDTPTTAIDTGKTITVSKVDVTVSGISANDKTYDATNSATINTSGASISGVITGDTVSVTGCQGQFADANAGSSKPLTVTNCALTGDDAGNYQLSAQPSVGTANIAPFALTAQGKVDDYYAIVGDTLDDSNLVQSNYELKNTTTAPETITITWPTVTLSFSLDSSCVTTAQNAGIPDCVLKATTGVATIANSSGADVTANYALTYSWTNGKLIVRPATVTETPTDPDTGIEIKDPSGQLPGNACPAVKELASGSAKFTAFDAEITTANKLHRAWDIKLVNCNTHDIIDPVSELTVTIPKALKDETTDFALWHKHFSGANHDVPEAVTQHDAAKYSRSGIDLSFTTDRFSYFAVSYASPPPPPPPPPPPGLGGSGLNVSRTLLLLLIALLGASAAVRSKAYRVP